MRINVVGTAPVRRIDIIRDNTFVHTVQNRGREVNFTYSDREVEPGEHYYYVRVQHVNEQIAWSSPIWTSIQ